MNETTFSFKFPGIFTVHTTYFNNAINSLRGSTSKAGLYWRRYFCIGSFFTLFIMMVSVCLLLINPFLLYRGFLSGGVQEAAQQQVLTPVIPGITIPFKQFFYLFLALIISGFVHEVGHAIAAASEGLELNGAGAFLFVLYPGFYVDLSERIRNLSPISSLKVYTAGAWNNFVLSLICWLLFFGRSSMLFPFYNKSPGGAIVLEIEPNSPLFGTNNEIAQNDIIYSLGDCPVSDFQTWRSCLIQLADPNLSPFPGYCVPSATPGNEDFGAENDVLLESWFAHGTNITECCLPSYSGHGQCFSLSRPGRHHVGSSNSCLDVRKVVESNDGKCRSYADCESLACALPVLDEGWMITEIKVVGKKSILYSGTPFTLWTSLEIGTYQPRFLVNLILPTDLSLKIPEMVETLLLFILSVSSGIGVLNMAPIYYLDGEWVFDSIISLIFPHHLQRQHKWSQVVKVICTALLVLNLIVSLIITIIRFFN